MTESKAGSKGVSMEGFVEGARRVIVVILLVGIGIYALLLLFYLAAVSGVSTLDWVMRVVNPENAVRVYTFGLPFCAVAAFGIVGLFEWHSRAKLEEGKLSFKAFNLEFSGPAGPVTLWVLCYLVLVGSIRLVA